MNATYASVIVSGVTSFEGSERSDGRYEKVESMIRYALNGNIESRWEVRCEQKRTDKTGVLEEFHQRMRMLFQVTDELEDAVCP